MRSLARILIVCALPLTVAACGTALGDALFGLIPGEAGEQARDTRDKAIEKTVDAADTAIDLRCAMTDVDRQKTYDMLVDKRREAGKSVPLSLDCDGDGEADLMPKPEPVS